MLKLTIFTPTYNREEKLIRLYQSLCSQSCKEFLWLIVDDGSNDSTRLIVEKWITDGTVRIQYIYQENAGKMAAHNKAAETAETELFFCVDSDDYLANDAVETILNIWKQIEWDTSLYGILAFKGEENGNAITELRDKKVTRSTLIKAYSRYGLKGDTALIFRTEVLKKFEFPVYPGEKFVPESFLYDQMDQQGELYLIRKVVYYVEYLEEGYSANIHKNLYRNPRGYFDYINQRLRMDESVKDKFLDSVRYDAMSLAHKRTNYVKEAVYPIYAWLALPFGYLLYERKYSKYVIKQENTK